MLKIEPPDIHYLLAASGWMELGNPAEANAELDRIQLSLREHPDVLKVRWGVQATTKNWEGALATANLIRDRAPNEPFGWIHVAYALHELRKTREAFDTLLPAQRRFPKCETIAYNLACYTAQAGDLPKATVWLEKAIEIGDAAEIKARALEDPDLKPLWKEIAKM